MTKGPHGQKRKADVVGNAVLIGKIAVGDIKDSLEAPSTDHHSRGGKKGGAARAAKLTPEDRSKIAKDAATKRWSEDR